MQNLLMAKKKPTGTGGTDKNRKPTRWARVRNLLARQLDELVKRNATDFTEEVNAAVRERLERSGLWPPPKG